ncbi:hypothetical protein PTKIN_Ptkin07bG0305700 [Pterospermum kingtungense]
MPITQYRSVSSPLYLLSILLDSDSGSIDAPFRLRLVEGRNTLYAVSDITSTIYKRCCQLGRAAPEFRVFLNDLPGNDFNTIFQSLPAFQEKLQQENGPQFGTLYIADVPGSFHGRLFPSKSLHFVHSSSSLHWLSQGAHGSDIEGQKNSRCNLRRKLFTLGLPRPSVSGFGLRGLIFQDSSTGIGGLILNIMQGLVEEDRLDTYNTPYYEPYPEEVEAEVEKEGSFTLERLELVSLPWDCVNGGIDYDRAETAKEMAKAIRAVNESMIGSHFGADIMDPLFHRFTEIMAADTEEVEHVSLVMSLIRNA